MYTVIYSMHVCVCVCACVCVFVYEYEYVHTNICSIHTYTYTRVLSPVFGKDFEIQIITSPLEFILVLTVIRARAQQNC